MIGLEEWSGGKAKTLAVVLHGWVGSRKKMKDVTEATKDALGPDGGVDVYVPQLRYRRSLSVTRVTTMVIKLLLDIDRIIEKRGDYKRIVLIGHSMGGVLGRRLFLVATGIPPGFGCEEAFAVKQAAARPWAKMIDRHVTLGAFNRGWQASERNGWWFSILFNTLGLVSHLMPRSTIFDLRVGSPFMVQTRLHWLAYRRWQAALRSAATSGKKAAEPAGDLLVVQVIGNADDLTSPLNQVDIVIDRPNYRAPPEEQSYFYLEMKNSTHDQTIDFTPAPIGQYRRELFINALTRTPEELQNSNLISDPAKLVEDLPPIDPEVTDGVFIIHGIRDDGFWTNRIAKRVKERAEQLASRACILKARTLTYGYFAMLPFVLPWIRQQKVEWFMDQYVAARAQFPRAEISFIGHSNGTYLAARALTDYDDARFKNIFFAGSVVQRDYKWQELVDTGRVKQFHNVRAACDWVVALLPKSVEWLRFFKLGGAGFDGFDEANTHPSITQAQRFANGGHSAAMGEAQWNHIADFIIAGKIPEETPDKCFVDKRPCWLMVLSETYLGLPLLIFVLLLGIPLLFIWPLLSTLAVNEPQWPLLQPMLAHGYAWPARGLSLPQAMGVTAGFAVYLAALKFFVTRV